MHYRIDSAPRRTFDYDFRGIYFIEINRDCVVGLCGIRKPVWMVIDFGPRNRATRQPDARWNSRQSAGPGVRHECVPMDARRKRGHDFHLSYKQSRCMATKEATHSEHILNPL